MVDCFRNSEARCKGRPVASALGRRCQRWSTALGIVKHGAKEGQLFQHWGRWWQGWSTALALEKYGDTHGRRFQHWENVLVENARRFSTGETRWKGRPSHSPMGKHGGGDGQLLQRW